MPKRRGNHEGSIYQRADDGRWIGGVTIGGRRITASHKTRRAAQEWVREKQAQVDEGLTVAGVKTTLGAYLQQWLADARTTIRPKTAVQYTQIVAQHIVPELGTVHLNDLRPDHVQSLYTRKLTAGASAYTVRLIHAVLHRALGEALRGGLVRRNVCAAVRKPKLPGTEMHVWDLLQVQCFLLAAREDRLECLYYLAVSTGLRQGELLGLRWSDLEWNGGTLQVQRQLQRTAAGLVYVEPKSTAGRRAIVLGSGDLVQLQAHRKRQLEDRLFAGGAWQESDVLFASTIGTPLDPRNVYRAFKVLLRLAGLPEIRFHDLRHTAATLMLSQGVHPKVVQERLGHASITLTLNTYSHVLPSMQQDAAAKIDALLCAK